MAERFYVNDYIAYDAKKKGICCFSEDIKVAKPKCHYFRGNTQNVTNHFFSIPENLVLGYFNIKIDVKDLSGRAQLNCFFLTLLTTKI